MQWLLVFVAAIFVFACQKPPDQPNTRGVEQVGSTVNPGSFGKYYALIIGVNDYKIWPKLKYARRDAENIGKVLTNQYTFDADNVTYLLDGDATLEKIMREVRRKLESLSENDNLLIYYAGHGQLDPLTETGYWIPVDGKLDVDSTWIMFTTLQTLLGAANVKAKNIILLTDSCYGGAIARGAPSPGNKSPEEAGYSQYEQHLKGLAQKRSRQVIASGGADVTVPDRSDFAQLIVDALTDNHYPLTDMEMLFFKDVYPKLRFSGQQDPVIARIAPRPGEDGQFVFVKRTVMTGVADASAPDPTTHRGQEPAPNGISLSTNNTDKGISPPPTTQTPAMPRPVIEMYQASNNAINQDDSATLSWRTKNATAVEITGLGNVALSGKASVSPTASTTYVLTASNPQGQHTTAEVVINVRISAAPMIDEFSATTTTVRPGEAVTLTWQTHNAARVEIIPLGIAASSGSQAVEPQTATTYTLIATNDAGRQVKQSITINLGSEAAQPIPSRALLIRPEVLKHVALAQLPNPVLVARGNRVVMGVAGGMIRYSLEISNWNAYPADFFKPAPNLAPCGTNTNAARSWLDIYEAGTNRRLYGFCALSEPKALSSLSFAVASTANPPKQIYVILTDRGSNQQYQSNVVAVK
ncbi:MAG: caspase family protein [Gammaproteobacteria bacterium]|nr:caspase family protein [Gammaproteobacteria bacterium]